MLSFYTYSESQVEEIFMKFSYRRHRVVQIIYTNKLLKLCFTLALQRIFNVNRGEIGEMYKEIGQNTQTLHRPGLQDEALFQVRVTAPTDRMSKYYKETHAL